MRGIRGILLAACCAGLMANQSAQATDPPSKSFTARDKSVFQQSRARELIVERAKAEARARSARMAARKRAGISLLRPVRTASTFGTVLPVIPIDHGIRISR
jgi:hypothetical protein